MTLHTIGQTLAGRMQPRRAHVGSETRARATHVAIPLPGSMRVLEAGMALTALATAILIGLGR